MTVFPDGFLWGASTAAHQTEGNNVNSDFWAVENEPDSPLPERSGDACDSYHRWREDLDLLAQSGLNSYRFSLDWSRIEPAPGQFSRAELAHYRRMIDGCLERGLTPVVTLQHFTVPRWFTEAGGWTADGALDAFARFTEAATSILGDVPYVCTINEPNMLAMLAAMLRRRRRAENVAGAMPPPDAAISDALVLAHARAVEVVRRETDAAAGWSIANQNFQALPGGESAIDEWAWSREDLFIDAARSDDYIGVQAYTRVRIGLHGSILMHACGNAFAMGLALAATP